MTVDADGDSGEGTSNNDAVEGNGGVDDDSMALAFRECTVL